MSIEGRCFKHGFELAENTCRNCGLDYCSECLVYSFGANKPPYCIPCALGASGVRSNATRQVSAGKKELKKMERERRRAEKAKGKAPKVEDKPIVEVDDQPRPPVDDDNPFAWADEQDSNAVPF